MMRGYLKVLVLNLLNEKPQTGYSLIKIIGQDTGKKPSYGSIYPLLEKLTEQKFIEYIEQGNKKIYKLTASGKQELKKLHHKESEVWKKTEEAIKLFMTISNDKNMKNQLAMVEKIKNKEFNVQDMPFQTHELKSKMAELVLNGKIITHKEKIGKILGKAVSELNKL